MSRRAYFTLSKEVLEKLLHLPADHHIWAIREADRFQPYQAVDIAIEGPGLRNVEDWEIVPSINPVFRQNEHRSVEIELPSIPPGTE